jgi:hypothetical protein
MLLWDTRNVSHYIGCLSLNPNVHKQRSTECGMITTIHCGRSANSQLVFGGFEDGTVAVFDIRTMRYS